MAVARSAAPANGSTASLLSVLVAAVCAIVLSFVGVGGHALWGAVLVGPVLVAVSVPALRRQAVREDDRRVFNILLAALLLKLAASLARHFVAFTVYSGVADASMYHDWGVRLSTRFWEGNFATGLDGLSDTNFIRFLTGVVYTVVGPSQTAGFIFFSWLGFCGLFLFYRAFTVAVPEGRRTSYRWFIFFVPSLLYWPSSVGKEAWMILALGIVAYGGATALSGRWWRSLPWLAAGLWAAAVVRPHVAGIAGLAVAAGFVMRRPKPEFRQLAPFVKVAALAVIVVVAAILVVRTDRFLQDAGVGADAGGVTSILDDVAERTGQGGSGFAPSILESPLRAPVAAVTVLFRPLLFDATNVQSLVAATEGTFLFLLALVRYRWIFTAIGSIRRQPYVALALAYTAIFVFGFSAIANFGLLARERAQLLPFFLMFLSIPPPDIAIQSRYRE